MKKYQGVPEMLEQFMLESGTDERWVSVHEIRNRFRLTRYQCTTVSGFLRRLEYSSFRQCPFIVTRIDRPRTLADKRACRYLVVRIKGPLAIAEGGTAGLISEKPVHAGGMMT